METQIDFSIKPILEGKTVILRPFEKNDWEKMIEILSDPELIKLTGSATSDEEAKEAMDTEEQERIKNWYLSRNEQKDRLDLAVVVKETGELVGEVVFNEYDEDTGNVNFRILIGPKGRNRGFGSEAISLFINYGFDKLELHKIELEVDSFNPRAEHTYQKNGFVLEGILRENFKYNDVYIDTKMYGMLKSDHRKR
jgi:RimJ/RimL family protein N-acetyltransferase